MTNEKHIRVNYGFSGASKGSTLKQYDTFAKEVNSRIRMGDHWHHGDCIGWDWESDCFISSLMVAVSIDIHPPINNSKRAHCETRPFYDHVYPPKSYLVRNHDIVDSVDFMFFCPSSMSENLRSGTWATLRYARTQKKPFIVIYPDGTTYEEHPE